MKKTIIIAEAGVNHNGNIELAKKLIDVAAEAGVDYVKFQTFKTEKLASKAAQKADYQLNNLDDDDTSQFEMLKKLELDLDTHKLLIDYCNSKNIQFLSTAFDLDSIELLASIDIPLFKIPSGEITNYPYLKKIGSYNKPLILSTGMANLRDIEAALEVLIEAGNARQNITVLHCNTEYPTPMIDVNLKAMNTIAQAFGVKIGYSDHTLGIEVPIAAVARGAEVIEKHFTLDRNMEGPDHKASLEPDELKAMVKSIRNIELALGTSIKQPSQSEQKNIAIARKSLHTPTELTAGHIIREGDLIAIRPGDGVSPMMYPYFIGKKVKNNLPKDSKINLSDFE